VPEGDTVHLAARRLDAALRGEAVSRGELRVPRFATTDLTGRRVLGVAARGKHLLFRFDDGTTLHTHFKMDGSWHLYRNGDRWRGPRFEVRAVLETERWSAVGFRLPVVEVVPTSSEGSLLAHLGPDVLGDDWDASEVVRRILRHPQRAISDVLIDQRIVAGPGNIYRNEVCFLAGVHPQTPVADITDVGKIVELTKRLMEANRTTARQVTTGDARPGRRHWVYGRGGLPCRRCRTPVERGEQQVAGGVRTTYWCPSCQLRVGSSDGGVLTKEVAEARPVPDRPKG
jgi:endonuclease-8